jgi:predicted ATPase/DNA-binding CsgD family transcriptional regulator
MPVAGVHGRTAALTSFVGRQDELAGVAGLLERGRLVTLAGPGGVGKTRLATEVGRRVADRFADGAWLVELAGVPDPELVPAAVAQALDLPLPAGDPAQAVGTLLAPRQLLLILDNCEHLLPGLCRPGLAELCATWLLAADDVRVLATSREPLGVSGESRYRLDPLRLPTGPEPSEAVELFADRARMADPGFRLDAATEPAVARLVTRLDGLPLAIELAAARVEALGVTQLAGKLEEDFRLLAAGRLAAGRHRTLAATAEWSYRLLDEPERRVFRMLSVLPGPFTLDAARAVAGDEAAAAVLRLVDCSLLIPPRAGTDGRSRYRMLQTLRDYGNERLAPRKDELGAASRSLACFAVSVAEQAAAGLQTSTGELDAAGWLDAEDALVHQALAWALDHDGDAALRLAVALTPWWSLRGRYTAGRGLLSAACKSVPEGSPPWCTAQNCLGRLTTGTDEAAALGHFTAARDALAGGPPTPELVEALAGRANCLLNLGHLADAAEEARQALDLATDLGYPPGEVRALWWLGASAYYSGDQAACLTWWRRIQRIDAAGLPGSLVRRSTLFLALALAETGELAEAHTHCERVLTLARQAGALFDLADALVLMADVSLLMGRLAGTRTYLREAMELTGRIGNDLFAFDFMQLSGHLCARTGRHAEAVTVWAADAALRRDGGIPLPPRDAQRRDEALGAAREALGPDRARAAQARGEAMSLSLAAEYVAMLAATEVDDTEVDDTEISAAGPRPDTAPQPLSTRERELVTLVAQGHTNAQIAQQLYISVRTVGSHLDRIRDKTGCRRRADLTRLALRAGLV